MRLVMLAAALAATCACSRGGDGNNQAAAATIARTGSVESNAAANLVEPAAANVAAANTMANSAAANTAATASAGGPFPENFPSGDPEGDGAECVVLLSFAIQANSRNTGSGNPAMQRAAGRWRTDVKARLGEIGTQQLIGSSVNPLMDTPAAQRDAAARWCVQHAPQNRAAATR